MTVERWDRVLTQYEFDHLAGVEKGRRALTSFERKVALLEALGQEPDGYRSVDPKRYKDRAKLRRWSDPERKLWAWGDPNVDSPEGKNFKLLKRYYEAISTLEKKRKGKPNGDAEEIRRLKDVIVELEQQNASLMAQLALAQSLSRNGPIKAR
ncbi:hypothetical protein [Neorhizobium galegae]|uniref:hypothetical protein n=1 Tax=Neorhizobium galegae TaxID=399 RepID=UPI0021032189|nr:hypothetical protein [Neorhizobium galegae]MCQ1839065.1 hypothetical protein [Neorhizobium galegae]